MGRWRGVDGCSPFAVEKDGAATDSAETTFNFWFTCVLFVLFPRKSFAKNVCEAVQSLEISPTAPPNERRTITRAEKNCPEELKKCILRLGGNGNICWNFNIECGCLRNTTGTPAKCMRFSHICAHCHRPGHSVTTCRSKPAWLAETGNQEQSDAIVTEAVDAAPFGTTQTVEPESPNLQFSFPTCGRTRQRQRNFFLQVWLWRNCLW